MAQIELEDSVESVTENVFLECAKSLIVGVLQEVWAPPFWDVVVS